MSFLIVDLACFLPSPNYLKCFPVSEVIFPQTTSFAYNYRYAQFLKLWLDTVWNLSSRKYYMLYISIFRLINLICSNCGYFTLKNSYKWLRSSTIFDIQVFLVYVEFMSYFWLMRYSRVTRVVFIYKFFSYGKYPRSNSTS